MKLLTILKKYPFIKIIKNKTNLGVGISRNKALKRASGEFLIFLDSDDELFDNSLTGLSRAIKKKKCRFNCFET